MFRRPRRKKKPWRNEEKMPGELDMARIAQLQLVGSGMPQVLAMHAAHCVSALAPSQKFGVDGPLMPDVQTSLQPPWETSRSQAQQLQESHPPPPSPPAPAPEPPAPEPPAPVVVALPAGSTNTLPPQAARKART